MYKIKFLIPFAGSAFGLHMDKPKSYGTAGVTKKPKSGRSIQGKSSSAKTTPDASNYMNNQHFDGEIGSSKTGAQCYITKTEKEHIEFNTRWVLDSAATKIIIGKSGKNAGVIQNEYDDLEEVSSANGTAQGMLVDAITPVGLKQALYLEVIKHLNKSIEYLIQN